uniref:Uncharacterized protein n=1 Tax=Anguilla anguilla TaxID=7936 RepID=A0A0E9PRD4_ANGAN
MQRHQSFSGETFLLQLTYEALASRLQSFSLRSPLPVMPSYCI